MVSVSDPPKLAAMEFRVVRPLGTGAGSAILLVCAKESHKDYALKVVKRQGPEDDIYVAQVLHEFEVLPRLDHRTIPAVYDCVTRRKWFKVTGVELLMEYLDGKSLADVEVKDIGQLVLIFSEIASGLRHMHSRGIYHGDLKPSNVMLTRAGAVKIIDFGTAWIKGKPKDRVQGTPQYMAPEQVSLKVVDVRTDLYNFGALMYRMLTGSYANFGVSAEGDGLARLSVFEGDLRGVKPRIEPPMAINPDVPGTLNEAVMACLELRPEARPAGAFEVKHKLKAVAKYMRLGKTELKGCDDQD